MKKISRKDAKRVFDKRRYVWSPENGGCLMEQRTDHEGIWRDWNSQDEGEYPVITQRVKAIVDWQNISVKRDVLQYKIDHHKQKMLDLQAISLKLREKQDKLMIKIRK